MKFANMLSNFVGCLYTVHCFAVQKLFWFVCMQFQLSIFSLLPVFMVSYPTNHCQNQCHEVVPFSSSFIDFDLMFTYLIHLQLIFVYGVRLGSNFTFCMWISFPNIICQTTLSPLCIFGILVKDQVTAYTWICLGSLFCATWFMSLYASIIWLL